MQAGLIGGERLFADSTLIDANAPVQSLVDRETAVFRRPEEPGKFVEALFQYDAAEEELSPAVPGRPNSVAQEVDERKRCWKEKKSKRGRKPSGKRRTNRRQVSTTDPDAAVVARPGMKAQLAYKNHFTVDGAHRAITAVRVTSADAEDSTQLAPLLDQQPIPARLVCADSHYGVAAVYEDIRRRGMRPAIPRRSSHTQKTKPDRIPLSEFHYDSDEDVYLCPRGGSSNEPPMMPVGTATTIDPRGLIAQIAWCAWPVPPKRVCERSSALATKTPSSGPWSC